MLILVHIKLGTCITKEVFLSNNIFLSFPGSNFKKAFLEFGVDLNAASCCESHPLNDSDEYLEPSHVAEQETSVTLPFHLTCASHTLIATTDVKNIGDKTYTKIYRSALAKCSALWNATGRPKATEVILKHLGVKPGNPCTTRWNSLYDSLNVINDKKNRK